MQGDSIRLCACSCGRTLPPRTHFERPPAQYIKGHVHKNNDPWVVCDGCGTRFECPNRGRRFCTRACCNAHRIGRQHPNFKGRVAADDGYVRIYRPGHPLAHKDGYVLEHRLIAYEAGLLTDPSHEVHHRNRTRDDNRPENLNPLPPVDHHRRHAQPGDAVVNQFGTFQVRTAEERLEESRRRSREYQRRKRLG